MRMPFMAMAVRMGMSAVTVDMADGFAMSMVMGVAVVRAVAMETHRYYGTRMGLRMQPRRAAIGELVGQFDTEGVLRD